MIVVIALKDCEFLGDNIYKLPFYVDGYNIVEEGFAPITEYFWGYSLGYIHNKVYKPMLYLHTFNKDEQIIFDSTLISPQNKWL